MAKSEIKKSKKSSSKKQEEKATKAVQKKEETSSSESSSSSSDESSSSSDSESESSSNEEEEKKEESSDSDSDSGSGSGSSSEKEDDDDEEKKKDESSSDSDSDSSSSDEEEKEGESSKKRKAESSEEESTTASPEPESKKAKSEEPAGEPATLFVGRLSWNIDDAWLKREFEAYPGVISARVITDRSSGRSKGFGYVDFESKSVAEKALEEMQGKEIDGRPINVDLSNAKPKQQSGAERTNERAKQYGDSKSEPSDTLFIGNLSFDSTRDSVTEFFAEYGPIMGVRLPTHPETEQLKGFGYVQFESVDAAQKALDALNGEYLNNRAVRLDFSTPKPQNERGGFGGNRGGNRGRGGFGGNRGGRDRGGFSRPTGSNNTPVAFRGNKKTFD